MFFNPLKLSHHLLPLCAKS